MQIEVCDLTPINSLALFGISTPPHADAPDERSVTSLKEDPVSADSTKPTKALPAAVNSVGNATLRKIHPVTVDDSGARPMKMNRKTLIARPRNAGATRHWIQVITVTVIYPPSVPIAPNSATPSHSAVVCPKGRNSRPIKASISKIVNPRFHARQCGRAPETAIATKVPAPYAASKLPKAAAPLTSADCWPKLAMRSVPARQSAGPRLTNTGGKYAKRDHARSCAAFDHRGQNRLMHTCRWRRDVHLRQSDGREHEAKCIKAERQSQAESIGHVTSTGVGSCTLVAKGRYRHPGQQWPNKETQLPQSKLRTVGCRQLLWPHHLRED